jgi:hypothetical protein
LDEWGIMSLLVAKAKIQCFEAIMKAYHLSSYDDVASPNFQTTPSFPITSASISFIQHNYVV